MAKTSLKKFSISKWISSHKKETILLGLIIVLAAFLRLYRISEYMTFLGDEGRDAIIVRRLLVEYHPPLIGPGTSIGNMYLGPLYYYFMAPFLLLANFNPVGPAIAVALLGVLTVLLVWYIAREWFGVRGALASAFLYSIAPTVIIYSRSSWNPNIMPFFALLSIYAIHRVKNMKEYIWLPILGVSFAWMLQSHYLGLLLLPVLSLFWTLTFFSLRSIKKEMKRFLAFSGMGLVLFLILMSPLVIFDARHGWRNVDAMKKFFSERQTTVSAKPWSGLPKSIPELTKINTRLLTAKNKSLGSAATIVMLVSLAWLSGVYRTKLAKNEKQGLFVLTIWITFGVIGLGLYKQEIYDHYYGFLMAAPFLFVGLIVEHAIHIAKWRGTWIALTAVVILAVYNLLDNPVKYPPNKQLERSQRVSEHIITESKGNKFNFAVIAERNYEDAYEYFLKIKKAPVVDINPQNTKDTIADQLFVVCEMPEEKCDPTHNAKAEVANFGWSTIETKWNVFGVTIYKLIHSKK